MNVDRTDDDGNCIYSGMVALLGIPNERFLQMAYKTNKPSQAVLRLKSEQHRRIFAEAFIYPYKLGPLSDLCVRALARVFPPDEMLASILEDPLKKRIYYDTLSVDLPIELCYKIEDELYWRRVVLAKSRVKSLVFKQTYDWKSLGISLKFIALIEAYKPEYFPKEYVKTLSFKIRDYVREMHIRQLQTMEDRSFEQYFAMESETDTTTESATITSSEGSQHSQRSQSVTFGMNEEDLQHLKVLAEEAAKRAEKRALKEAQIKRRASREERRLRKHPPTPPPPSKRRRKFRPKGVFDIPIEEDENEAHVLVDADRRDQLRLFNIKLKREYKPDFSHHIDLRFVQYFVNLTIFTIEFQGPHLAREYHTKHFNFSYGDMSNLAFGLKFSKHLEVFRLRNSRMDAKKLKIIVDVLRDLKCLKVIDFGYDQLQDDCGPEFYTLFQNSTSIRELELEANSFGMQVLQNLADGLVNYEGHLEYLGLGGSYLEEGSLHELTSKIVGTSQISHLCLKGTPLGTIALKCCVAEELLTQHTALRRLDVRGVDMNPLAAIDIVQALRNNLNILQIDCRGCGLSSSIEADMLIVCQRNNYLLHNPYIGMEDLAEEDIEKFTSREKNPILLGAKEAVRKRSQCMKDRPCEVVQVTTPIPSFVNTQQSFVSLIMPQRLDYEPNDFDEGQFHKHVLIPGPGERTNFFREERLVHI